jgi:hypothetical protein
MTLCVVLLTLLLVQAPNDLSALPLGDTVEGVIEDDDAEISTKILAAGYTESTTVGKTWRVEVKKSGRYCIDFWGYGFDAYLVLRDDKGEVVAEDDDGMGGTDARLNLILDAQITYRLEVGALHGQRGEYELELYRGGPDPEHTLQWSDKAIQARIQVVFVKEAWKKVDVVKSKHYLVLTDSGAGKKFGKILDKDIYKGFFKFYDLDLPKAHRPLFVYLFNTREAYIDFLMRQLGMSKDQASKTGGIAYRDYYVTSYTSPRDPTHFHECAHQIMSNLLGLSGGGSWFQEGVATYYEDEVKHFNREAETNMLITTKQSVPLRDLFAAQSMLFSAGENVKGGGGAGGMYGEAASVILLIMEGPHKKRFHDFLFAMGKVPRSNLKEIERVLQEVCGTSIDGLDEEWREYFGK